MLASTLEAFADRFRPWGFDPKAYVPCYGLAESSVALTFPPIDREPVIDAIDRKRFERAGEAAPAVGDDLTLRFVANGVALPDHEVKVADEQGAIVGERVRGRILFRGPSRTAGYYRNLKASRAVIDEEGWMDSGDLGYLAGGEVYVTGRLKDVIIKSGHNIIPQDVELAAAEVAGVRKGCVAAFGSLDDRTGTERIVVVAETRVTDPAERRRIVREVTENVAAKVGMPPDAVQLAPPHAVPKTSSGKIRRAESRQLYETGAIAGRKADAPWVQMLRLWAATAGGWSRRAGESVARWTAGGASSAWRWGAAAAFGLPARLAPNAKSAAPLLRAGLRVVAGLNGANGPVADGPAVYLVNRHGPDDAAAWLTAVSGAAVFVGSNQLEGLPGPAAFLAEPLTLEGVDIERRIADALKRGLSVIAAADSPPGEPPERCRFRLEALQAAVEAGCDVIPAWRDERGCGRGGRWVPSRETSAPYASCGVGPGASSRSSLPRRLPVTCRAFREPTFAPMPELSRPRSTRMSASRSEVPPCPSTTPAEISFIRCLAAQRPRPWRSRPSPSKTPAAGCRPASSDAPTSRSRSFAWAATTSGRSRTKTRPCASCTPPSTRG